MPNEKQQVNKIVKSIVEKMGWTKDDYKIRRESRPDAGIWEVKILAKKIQFDFSVGSYNGGKFMFRSRKDWNDYVGNQNNWRDLDYYENNENTMIELFKKLSQ